ncbi:MAG: GNAT family N-acetyltransferase [Flavobacteriales bacterium]
MRPYDILKGDKIFLRALEPQDVEVLYEWENNTENWSLGNTNIPFSKQQLKEYILSVQDIYSDKQVRFIICLNDNAEEVGCIDLFDFDPKNMRAAVGILIGSKEHRGKGFASDALGILIEYAFHTLILHQLHCTIPDGNKTSEKLFLKHGFQHTATRKEWIRTADGWKDELFYQLINQEK